MAAGAAEVLRGLHDDAPLGAALAIGGSGGTTIAAAAMQALPIGVPKLIVSTVAAGDVRPYVRDSDIGLMYAVTDIAGLNRISRRVLGNAAAAAAGMAAAPAAPDIGGPRVIGATMFGVTTPCVTVARHALERRGYEVLVFHATGTGGRSMERLIDAGVIRGALDATTTELADEVVGGELSAGPERMDAAGRLGLPQVVSLGALDMVNFGPRERVPERFADRLLYEHNAATTLMRTSVDDCRRIGELLAAKLNAATEPPTLFVPLRGLSALSAPGEAFEDRAADRALIDAVEGALDAGVDVLELDLNINEPAFAEAMADRLDDRFRVWERHHEREAQPQ
jgi:uncharacterized protein (UPF0261 family)